MKNLNWRMKKRAVFLIVLSCFTATVFAQQSKIEYGNNAKSGKYADIRGFKMYYEIYGKGKPLLIIHGNGGSINNFQYQIPYFSKSYQVIVADSRAQGKSRDDADSLSYEMMADDLSALLDYLKLDSCFVIGWSDGGNNGLLLAIRHPEKVKKLAITGANLWPDTSAVDPFAYQWAISLNDSISKVPVTPESKNARKVLHLLSYEPHISTSQLKLIKCPALVIGGDNDVILPAHTLLIAASIPSAYLWILPNSGHSTPIFYKDEFNRKVDEFFKAPFRKIEGMGKLD
jgi:pimeloyl-ACP methyl ester carboxylesterase